jgi:hypothetical protein
MVRILIHVLELADCKQFVWVKISLTLLTAFFGVGDFVFDGFTDDLAQLLDDGIRVSLINGDRDFRCNCK